MFDDQKLGMSYLERGYDREAGATQAEPPLYDAKDPTPHAVCVGMAGSGKTGLGLCLLHELPEP